MMDTSPDLSRTARSVRIAIAIAVLRHKPPHQSFDAYVLDLRARFVPKAAAAAALEYDAWRQKALALEKKLRDAEEKYQNERVELTVLQAKMLSDETNAAKTKTQKKKKAASVVPGPFNASLVLDRVAATTFSSFNVLISVQNLGVLVEQLQARKKKRPGAVFVSACKQALGALAQLLSSALSHDSASDHAAAALEALSLLCPQLVTCVLPILAREPARKQGSPPDACSLALDDFLGTLARSLLVPLVPSFASASDTFYAALSTPKEAPPSARKSTEVADTRPGTYALLEALVSALLGTASSSGSARLCALVQDTLHLLALETTRELGRLFPEPTLALSPTASDLGDTAGESNGAHASTATGARSVARLARKDALWYLCAAMHVLLDGWDGRAGCSVLQDAVCAGLSALFRRTRPGRLGVSPASPGLAPDSPAQREEGGAVARGRGMDDAEREMLLAVVEKYWLKSG